MVAYQDEDIFPVPPDVLWKLLQSHLDDAAIHTIHPLVLSQRTISHDGTNTIVERTIDARGKFLQSRWKITYQPPELARWEILDGEGPWAPGSFIENRYSADPGGTRIQSRGEMKISVLPFFLPQRSVIRRVFGQLDREDRAALKR